MKILDWYLLFDHVILVWNYRMVNENYDLLNLFINGEPGLV